MSCSLIPRQKGYCLNSSATVGSDNSFNSSTYVCGKGSRLLPHPASIPLHCIGITTSLIVLQSIGKRRSVTTEGEVVAGVRS